MRAREISGNVGRIAVVALFVLAAALWALAQYSPQAGGAPETPNRRPLGNVKLLSHTATTTAVLTYTQSGSASNRRTRFTVTLSSSDPACVTGRNVNVTRSSPAATVSTTEESTGVYRSDNGLGRTGTWQASVTQSTYTTYGGETHTCSAATSNTVSVPA